MIRFGISFQIHVTIVGTGTLNPAIFSAMGVHLSCLLATGCTPDDKYGGRVLIIFSCSKLSPHLTMHRLHRICSAFSPSRTTKDDCIVWGSQDGIGELEYSASCSASASGGSTSNFSGPSSGSGSGGGSANKVDSPILGLVTEADSFTRAAQTKHSHKTRQGQ